MAFSKIILNGTTLMDVTDTTATTPDVVSPKVFYDSAGVRSTGSGSSGLDYTVREVTVTGNAPTVTRDFTNFIFIAQVAEDELPATRPNTNAYYLEFAFVDGNFIRKSGNKAFAVVTTGSTTYYNGAGTNASNLAVGSTSITFTTYTSQIMYQAKWKILQIELPSDYPLYSFYPLS